MSSSIMDKATTPYNELNSELKSIIKQRLGCYPGMTITEHARQRLSERWPADYDFEKAVKGLRKCNIIKACPHHAKCVFNISGRKFGGSWDLVIDLQSDCWTVVTVYYKER